MKLKPSTAPHTRLVAPTAEADSELPVGSRENMLDIITKVLETDPDPRCQLLTRIKPVDLVREEAGRALFQLRAATIRFPLKNYIQLKRNLARGATRAQLIDACENAKRWQPGEWRIVGATHSENFKIRWERVASGITPQQQQATFANPPKQEADPQIQRKKPQQVRDPVLLVHVALAEVSRQRPRQGQRNQKQSNWDTFVAEKGLLEYMPYKGRQTRAEAIRIICDQFDLEEEDIVSDLSEEQVARINVLRGYGLTDEEIAGAFGAQVAQISKVPLEVEDDA